MAAGAEGWGDGVSWSPAAPRSPRSPLRRWRFDPGWVWGREGDNGQAARSDEGPREDSRCARTLILAADRDSRVLPLCAAPCTSWGPAPCFGGGEAWQDREQTCSAFDFQKDAGREQCVGENTSSEPVFVPCCPEIKGRFQRLERGGDPRRCLCAPKAVSPQRGWWRVPHRSPQCV